jgi:MFS family permease
MMRVNFIMVIEPDQNETNYRWWILILATLTNTMVAAIPAMCLPVLFEEISSELKLSLVQVGMVWGIGALPGIFTALLGGAIGDRFGPKRVLMISCLLVGLTGALRGVATGFASLAGTVFLLGMFLPFITMNTLKTCGTWFPRRQLGLASGVLSMGMALGFLVSSMFSATVLSPWLDGWRHVLFFYGGIAVALSLPWLFSRPLPVAERGAQHTTGTPSLRQSMAHISRIRNIWLFGLTILGVGGCVQGALGYLPLYLRGLGWPAANADGALAAFHTISMICVIPIAFASDKLGSRKKVLVAAGLMIALGVGFLSIAGGAIVWVAVCMAGMVRDGFMAVFMTAIIETEEVGVRYAGTATGMVMIFGGIGSLLAPPLGNSLALIAPGFPFVFWAALTGLGFFGLLAAKERSAQRVPTVV